MTDPGVHHADPGVHDGVIFVFTMVRYPQARGNWVLIPKRKARMDE
jgi:hypothetical protein